MTTGSRGWRDVVVRALARVGLVWALFVLAALFMAMSAQGLHHDSLTPGEPTGPSTAGLALALVLLGAGLTVLAIGASRGHRRTPSHDASEPHPLPDFARLLGLLP